MVPKYFPYPKLQLVLNYSGALFAKNEVLLSQGIGNTDEIDESYKSVTEVWRPAVEDLKLTKGTYLDNIYDSVNYFKNVCQKEIGSDYSAECRNNNQLRSFSVIH